MLLGWNKFHFGGVVFDLLSCKVEVYLEMLGFFVEHWVVAKFDATLIVTVEMSRFVIKNFEFS